MIESIFPIVLALLGLWLLILSFFVFKSTSHYQKLVSGQKGSNLKKILEKIIDQQKQDKKKLIELEAAIGDIRKLDLNNLKKIGFVRFNPFSETGGDHSFSVCLLDGHDDGFVLTGLHTREKTRMYVKSIIGGESKFELSKEEKKSLGLAKRK